MCRYCVRVLEHDGSEPIRVLPTIDAGTIASTGVWTGKFISDNVFRALVRERLSFHALNERFTANIRKCLDTINETLHQDSR